MRSADHHPPPAAAARRRVPALCHAAWVLVLAWLFLEAGLPWLTGRVTGVAAAPLTLDLWITTLTIESVRVGAPLPGSLRQMYLAMVVVGILVYVSVTDEGWRAFGEPLRALARTDRPSLRLLRALVLLLGAGAAAALAFDATRVATKTPSELRTVHPTLPLEYESRRNPLPWSEDNVRRGRELFVALCSWCHGDQADGQGPWAAGLQPAPIDFTDPGTIAQLPENYVFWRVKEGGAGLPPESWPWSSAMPAWNPSGPVRGVTVPAPLRLSDEDVWRVVMGAYTLAGQTPARRD